MSEIHQLIHSIQGISAHAWSPNGKSLAICPNNNEIHIYLSVPSSSGITLEKVDMRNLSRFLWGEGSH